MPQRLASALLALLPLSLPVVVALPTSLLQLNTGVSPTIPYNGYRGLPQATSPRLLPQKERMPGDKHPHSPVSTHLTPVQRMMNIANLLTEPVHGGGSGQTGLLGTGVAALAGASALGAAASGATQVANMVSPLMMGAANGGKNLLQEAGLNPMYQALGANLPKLFTAGLADGATGFADTPKEREGIQAAVMKTLIPDVLGTLGNLKLMPDGANSALPMMFFKHAAATMGDQYNWLKGQVMPVLLQKLPISEDKREAIRKLMPEMSHPATAEGSDKLVEQLIMPKETFSTPVPTAAATPDSSATGGAVGLSNLLSDKNGGMSEVMKMLPSIMQSSQSASGEHNIFSDAAKMMNMALGANPSASAANTAGSDRGGSVKPHFVDPISKMRNALDPILEVEEAKRYTQQLKQQYKAQEERDDLKNKLHDSRVPDWLEPE